MASGSQTWRGICADFPHAPTNSAIAMADSAQGHARPASTASMTLEKSSVPKT
jgi:hypothetical protein